MFFYLVTEVFVLISQNSDIFICVYRECQLMSEKYFKKMIELLEEMNTRLENIERKLSTDSTQISAVSSIDLLKQLPKSHIDTYFALKELGEATCTEVAKKTGRSHNLESRYLVKLRDLSKNNGLKVKSKRVPVSDKSKRGTEVKYFIEEGK